MRIVALAAMCFPSCFSCFPTNPVSLQRPGFLLEVILMPGHYGMKKPAMKKGAKKMPAAMMAKMKKMKATKKKR